MKIFIGDAAVKLTNQAALDRILLKRSIRCLIDKADADKAEVDDFDGLQEGGLYLAGPASQQQGPLSCSFFWFCLGKRRGYVQCVICARP